MNIPGEAIYSALEAFWANEDEPYMTAMKRALEAAAPHIAANALEEAADEFEDLPANKGAEISSGTWDWFELFPIAHLRERVDRLTQRTE
jgi:hypothetical protein